MPEIVEFHRMSGEIDYLLRMVVRPTSRATTLLPAADPRGGAEPA
ncbi:MAG: Lrp/AsnC ligand binding domain-containing protein [Pseudorhodoferax sp.]